MAENGPTSRDFERLERSIERLDIEKAEIKDMVALVGDNRETRQQMQNVLVELASLRTELKIRFGFVSGVGAIGGGGLVTLIFYLAGG